MRIRLTTLLALIVVAAGSMAPAVGMADPCGLGTLRPQCDGACSEGQMCADNGVSCVCQPTTSACQDPGNPNGPPVCWGVCPPSRPICATLAGGCACEVPTLSEWGIIIMSLAMFGAVLHLRRRHAIRS